ncbi:hypothetical protein [Bacteroides togonis]|uniref:hypothetical protein n=1 Tax=Bacteroides togonis TaxID=1917883 RepID=UPI00094B36DB|nr:hypothetical protein [Bacteroides togonis]
MKYLKLLALLALPLCLSACSDDDEFNVGNATVGFATPEITIKENTTSLNVPITVEGDHTGLIKVNVIVKDAQGTNVEIDKNIILTSGDLKLPANVSTINAEINLSVYTKEDDFNRSFTLEIESAQGATVRTSTCKINLEEAVDAYDKLIGNWVMNASGAAGSIPVSIAANAEGTGYDCVMNYQGIDCKFRMNYSATGIEIIAKEAIASGLNFGDPIGVADIYLALLADGLYWQNIPGMWNDTFDTITLEAGLAGAIMVNGSFSGSVWFQWTDCILTKSN